MTTDFFSPFFFGYLDPGSGSMLFSAIVGIIATLYFLMKSVFYKLIDLPQYLAGNKTRRKAKHRIVFYSEGGQYWNVFMPIVRELNHRKVHCTYFSSKEDDPGLTSGFEYVEARYIGEGSRAFFTMNTLEADVCIMTTPGLDVLQIKRSKGVKKYCHVTHSAGGMSGYSTYGLDYYDIVWVGGHGDEEMIRDLESKRNILTKDIDIIGCTYLDVLREKLAESSTESPFGDSDRHTVLLSPTWGKHGLLSLHGKAILKAFVDSQKFNIIVRPHPQSFISDKPMMESLMEAFPEGEALIWDRQPDGLASLSHADAMISDFSGIIFDFFFLFNRPVLYFSGEYDNRGKEAMDLSGDSWIMSALKKLGEPCKKDDIPQLPQRIDSLLQNATLTSEMIKILQEGMDKHPGESGRRGADAIERIIQDLNKNP